MLSFLAVWVSLLELAIVVGVMVRLVNPRPWLDAASGLAPAAIVLAVASLIASWRDRDPAIRRSQRVQAVVAIVMAIVGLLLIWGYLLMVEWGFVTPGP